MLLGLAEAVSRWVWHATDDLGIRFVAAMVSVGLGVVGLVRLGQRLSRRR